MPSPDPLAARYDALWDDAAPRVRAGGVSLDPWALRKEADPRRGVTLLARPAPEVAAALGALAGELRRLEPEQYYHPAGDLHLTVLSFFSATAAYPPFLAHLDAYRAATIDAMAGIGAIEVDVRGVTLSTGAVLAQGFPRGGGLARLRERLRGALGARGLAGALDRRYRLETAHLTLARFTAPLRDPRRFVGALEEARGRWFGAFVIPRLELVLGDWYQSSGRTVPLGTYALSGGVTSIDPTR